MKPRPFSALRAASIAGIFLQSAVWVGAQTWTPATRDLLPVITSSGLAPAGYRLAIEAPPGSYSVQRSTGLLAFNWQPVGTISPAGGFGQFTDPAALSLDNAFYRIAGGFQETPVKLLSFSSSVSSGGIDGFDFYGGLWTGHATEDLLFQRSNPVTGQILALGGEFASFRMEPLNPAGVISAVLEVWDDNEILPVTTAATSWVVDTEDGDLRLFKLEGNEHSLIGISQSDFGYEVDTEFGTYFSDESEVEMLWAISKSTNATPAGLAGAWGFVRILVDGVESDAIYNGEAWTTNFTTGPNPRSFSISNYTEFDIEHAFPFGDVDAIFGNYTQSPPQVLSLNLATDGEVVIRFPSGAEAFKGIVSPTGKLLVASGSDPSVADLLAGETDVFLPELEGAVTEWLVGVKRAVTPQLAGKTYRVIRQGWWAEGDYFEIEHSGPAERLVFNAAGTAVSRTSDFNFEYVFFDGALDWDKETFTFPMSVNVNAEGQILLRTAADSDTDVRTFGFAQEGSNLLILVDSWETDTGAAGVALMIAVAQ